MLLPALILVLVEAGVILSLMFKTPARKAVMVSLDRMKRGCGPVIVKSVAVIVLALLAKEIHSMVQITGRGAGPTDRLLVANCLLRASLMGFLLFLALLTDRLHHYMRELRRRRKSTKDAVRRNDGKYGGVEEILAREEQVGTFRDIVRQFETELDDKSAELVASEAKINVFKKQYEGLVHDYEQLISKNQQFRSRLQSLDTDQVPSTNPLDKTSDL